MRKGILFIISCLFLSIFSYAQTAVTGVSLSSNNLTLGINEKHLLTPTIIPVTAIDQTVTWSTSDANIASVYHGLITAKTTGIVDIIVTTNDGNFRDTCKVTVATIPVTGVTLDRKTLHLKCGECYQLKASISPQNATDKSVSYTSKDEYIATVSSTGLIWAGDPDTTLIIVETNDGNLKDTCVVIVEVPSTASVREVSLDKKSITLTVGSTSLLEETILPRNATNKKVYWSSNNYAVADVVSGQVTAKSTGSAFIYVKTVDKGKMDSCLINVIPEDFIHIDPQTSANEAGTINLSITTPDNTSLTGSFLVEFPTGISLDENTTKLSAEYEKNAVLSITNKENNSWLIEIKEKTPVLHTGALQNVLDIGIKKDESVINGDYLIKFSQLNFLLNDGSELKKDLLNINIFIDDTAIDLPEVANVQVYRINNHLCVQSIHSEVIYVYSFNGTLLHTMKKTAGEVVFDINLQESVLIVKGSTGWVKKIAK